LPNIEQIDEIYSISSEYGYETQFSSSLFDKVIQTKKQSFGEDADYYKLLVEMFSDRLY
jgi:hypothetical protein